MGKGLSALLENAATDITTKAAESAPVGSIAMLKIEEIEANPFNPRTDFEHDALEDLSKSIATHGIIQPLTVRKLGRDKYQLISGERRFRASQLAGLTEVPAYIRIANDQAMLEMALVENIQREDLNPIEIALSYQQLIDECNLTQEQMSQKIAKSRSSITNHLRLLKLPAIIQLGLKDKVISMGHARALVSAGDEDYQLRLFEKVVLEELSVRQLEALLKVGLQDEEAGVEEEKAPLEKTAEISSNQQILCAYLGDKISSKVEIKKNQVGKGKIMIHFNSEVDLNRIFEILK